MVDHAGRSHKRGKSAADGYGTDYVQRQKANESVEKEI